MWKLNDLRSVVVVAIVGLAGAGAACTDAAVSSAKSDTSAVVDATKKAGDKTIDATKDAGAATMAKAKEVAGDVADKSKELASAAGDAATDTWITAKVKAKFGDEKTLKGVDIGIKTAGHVVTLSGAVPSADAQALAVAIAHGTEGVTRVVDNLVVR